jgi:hypothetical protein
LDGHAARADVATIRRLDLEVSDGIDVGVVVDQRPGGEFANRREGAGCADAAARIER